jgi:hypothetical protein
LHGGAARFAITDSFHECINAVFGKSVMARFLECIGNLPSELTLFRLETSVPLKSKAPISPRDTKLSLLRN